MSDAEARYRELDALPLTPQSLPALLAALKDESWRVRRLAAERLAGLEPTAELIAQLVALLGRRDETGGRNAAASVLAQLGAPALPAVVELLGHSDPDQRKFAADILGQLKRSEAVTPLVHALADGDANVRTAAAEALGLIGGGEARRALEALLGAPDVLLRVCALEGLTRLERPVSLPALTPLLADPLTRRSAWRLLGHVRHPTAARLLVRGLASLQTRDAALGAIGAAGAPLSSDAEAVLRVVLQPVADVTDWLGDALGSHEADRRLGALRVSAALGDARLALAVAASARGDRDGQLALETLLRLGEAGARALLSNLEGLADLPGEARAVTSDALVRLAEPSLCGALVTLMDSGDPELAELGVTALGRTHAREAIAPLVRSFEDDVLAAHAWRSLVTLAHAWPDEVKAALAPLVSGALRPHAVRAWAELMGAQAHDVIKRALHDSHEAVRAAAAEASVLTPKDSLAVLQAAFMDESALVRRAAARAIGKLPPLEAQPLLARALQDADPSVLALACASAGQLGATASAPRLDALTRHVDPAVGLAALEALALVGGLTDEHLLGAARHADPEVVKLAFNLGAERTQLLDAATAALWHPRWDVRVAAARLLAVSAGREALAPLQDAVARETADGVAHELLDEAVELLSRRV